ncbi:general secretion pathway protein GspB [Vibrio rhodolitus]|uniref:general secretion pathway protein GspB n=1 Tax=Vibrio rhodolitus TaxID=2231649 RepID=UPI000E0AC5EC|nr:general secretion pathway protein GspB [Vibrio rhodolitus]
MANLIQSLEESQQGYQVHHSNAVPFYSNQQSKPKSSWGKHLLLFALPVVTASLVTSGLTYLEMRDAWLASNQGGVEVIEFSKPILTLNYPDVGALQDTYLPPAEPVITVASAPEPTPVPVSKQTGASSPQVSDVSESDDLLQGIDFSTLSPDVAQLLQSAMSSDLPSEEADNALAQSQLTSDANLWTGRLPALNFQTHVYSSNPSKRWVKVNNGEYQEGSWLADGVKLVAIEPQVCVIEFEQQRIEIPALYDWQG